MGSAIRLPHLQQMQVFSATSVASVERPGGVITQTDVIGFDATESTRIDGFNLSTGDIR
jgi:hypothetical protein